MMLDSSLQHDIEEQLENDPEVDVQMLGVQVQKGVVTLTGTVSSDPEKWKADDIARRVAGVAELISNLQVTKTFAAQNADVASPWFPSGG
jgi:osmotically-inducible protein OsmY